MCHSGWEKMKKVGKTVNRKEGMFGAGKMKSFQRQQTYHWNILTLLYLNNKLQSVFVLFYVTDKHIVLYNQHVKKQYMLVNIFASETFFLPRLVNASITVTCYLRFVCTYYTNWHFCPCLFAKCAKISHN